MTGMWRGSARSSEAAMKYFLMGAFATGFLLYGIALIYGATGSTNLNAIADFLVEQPSDWPIYLIGGGFLLLIGFAFKVGAVPFHFWVPDVYDGAPTPVAGFMSVAVKAAAFAAWCRGFLAGLGLGGIVDVRRLGEDARDFLADVGRFTRLALDAAGDEDEERALSELTEFTRMGVMIVRAECQAPGACAAEPPSALH